VILTELPPGLTRGLPRADQRAIRAMVGTPVRLSGYDDIGRAELEFADARGDRHFIYVHVKYVRPARARPARRP
jgi:hypothetical protein